MRDGIAAVLFDLDGTLVDSAPDLAAVANQMRRAHGFEALPYEDLRMHAGSGARGMLGAALSVHPGDERYPLLRDEFLDSYADCLLQTTQAFAAIPSVLEVLQRHGVPWGIVTNKALRLAEPLVQALLPAPQVLVGGDSTAYSKPHPAPLLEAARRLALAPGACVYVGDDARDMVAGRSAGMATLAAAWGYLGPGAAPQAWAADQVLEHADGLLQWLDLA